ncbi:trans-1,2-dihydrobenzene-1,2-diol dehydrogenase-like protein [Labeo rohita]|uniref:Trans-1,2-dihydrobenzene-1,2-diol dehydrogenase-like protein n=1 Tax=Labeo rohita TaxID=84645 RepID=A0A498NXF5_LABRO|nr:trans-1,2-dihydrobenzene-1,2-diol dehydrogenase-like protein [Labeo rohita]
MNFHNSTGLRYEAEEVRRCLLKGVKESAKMSLSDSELLMEVLDEARRQAVWTRFFPVSLEISRLLSRDEVGEVKVVRADFGIPLMHVPRAVQKELGGGALLYIGIYCVQFALMVFNGEKPESIQATGVCLDTGVDEAMIITLKFSGHRLAVCTCTISAQLPNEALIVGTKGTIKVVAVAARDLKHAQEFAQKHNIPRAYGSYEELAKDPEIGVEESTVVVLKFPRNRMAICACTIDCYLPNDATICGTKGTIRVSD